MSRKVETESTKRSLRGSWADLDQLKEGVALKVPLAELAESKENVRAALNRASHKGGRSVATATDVNYLYVWNQTQ